MYSIDESLDTKNPFLKYFFNCAGWYSELNKTVDILYDPESTTYSFDQTQIMAGPRPSKKYDYPFPEVRPLTQGVFETAYVIWTTMGKLNEKKLTSLIRDGKLTFEEWEELIEKAKRAVSSDAFIK